MEAMEAGAGRHDSRAAAGFEWVGGEDVGQERSREPGARSAANPSPSPKSKDGETLGKFSSDESLCPGDGPVMTTARLAMLPPAETRDGEVLELMNDEQTMLPWLPFLCPMRPENNAKRRKNQRKEFSEKKGMFLDLLDRKTGELVGTSGFRVINYKAGEAEWGAVIRKPHQKRGLCSEAYDACQSYLERELVGKGIVKITASTLPDNVPMVSFLLKKGLTKAGSHTFSGKAWHDFEKCVL